MMPSRMRSLTCLVLAGCFHGAPAPVSNTTPTPPSGPRHIAFRGPRATIEHEFLPAGPISVYNPTSQAIDVATATESVMLATVRIPTDDGEVEIMLAADGKSVETLRELADGDTVVSEGRDAELVWRIVRTGAGYDFAAIRRGLGVWCDPYHPDDRPFTRAQVETLVAVCRDIQSAGHTGP